MSRLADQPGLFVVQVGAGDGIQGDFLRPYLLRSTWHALLLEPIAHIYEQLVANYRNCPQVRCERFAIADRDGFRPMYRIEEVTGLPWWADQLASFDKSVVLSHSDRIPDLAHRLTTESVPCLTVRTFITRFELKHVDVLLVDTEGLDAMVVTEFLRCGISPAYLLFEHKHLRSVVGAELETRLLDAGYLISHGPADCWCWRSDANR